VTVTRHNVSRFLKKSLEIKGGCTESHLIVKVKRIFNSIEYPIIEAINKTILEEDLSPWSILMDIELLNLPKKFSLSKIPSLNIKTLENGLNSNLQELIF
jgi:hypothetical protein